MTCQTLAPMSVKPFRSYDFEGRAAEVQRARDERVA
jgi:hypothetical protein